MAPPKSEEERLEEAHRRQLEQAAANVESDRLTIQEWGDKGWAGTGEHLDVNYNDLRPSDNGGMVRDCGPGIIEEQICYRGVVMAQKCIDASLSSTKEARNRELAQLKTEMNISEKLASHRHIITLVGTYWKEYSYDNLRTELDILTFPVAICNLATFLDDCAELQRPERARLVDLREATNRFLGLGFGVNQPAGKLRLELHARLRECMGCLTSALKWMQHSGIRSHKLTVEDILLRPGALYVSVFGPRCSTRQAIQIPVAASTEPQGDAHDQRKSGVYSLGCIFLHILTVIYGTNDETEYTSAVRTQARELRFQSFLGSSPTSPPGDPTAPYASFPLDLTRLLARMLHPTPARRPTLSAVKKQLQTLGGDTNILLRRLLR